MKKKEDDKIDDKKMMNVMITKMIKKWKQKYFKDFQCVAGSVLHKYNIYILYIIYNWYIDIFNKINLYNI